MSTNVKRHQVKRPDQEKYNAELNAIRKTIDALILKRNELSGKFDKEANDKQNNERNELRKALEEIRIEQGKNKKGRQDALARIKELQTVRRKKIDELRSTKQKLSISNSDDIDAQISQLEKSIESGVSVNEEKQLLKEISKLKQAKNTLSKVEKAVDEKSINEKINAIEAEIKDFNEEREPLEQKYTEIKKKLDAIEEKRKAQSADFKSNKEERNKIQEEIEANIQRRRDLVTAFKAQKEEYRAFAKAERERREEERKKRIQAEKDEKLARRFEAELELAEIPAFTEEINSCNTLIGLLNNQLENKSESANEEAQKNSVNLESSVPEGAYVKL